MESADFAFAPAIGAAANFFYKKNSPLGTACVTILARAGTPEALKELTVLAGRVKASSHKLIVQIARERVAARNEVPLGDLDELTIPTSGLTQPGYRSLVLEGFTAEVEVVGNSAELRWKKPNGQPQASIPAAVKNKHANELQDLKRSVKEIETTLTMVSRRFESAPMNQRSWKLGEWKSRYLEHPVAGTVARRLLWELSGAKAKYAAALEGDAFVDVSGRKMTPPADTRVALWHPIQVDPKQVLAWREFLLKRQITQPFKQAHREVYLLTEAERRTRIYSNRFAAHVLGQSRFRTLAKSRGWTSGYLGPWDTGDEGIAQLNLPNWNLRAEFWVTAAGEDHTPVGGYFYVATDQVRFFRPADSRDPLPLADVPPLVFSEVLRDVDLFVGVASVGNNPQWQDGGPDGRYRDYWQDFSFGELSESATTRRAALSAIVPKLTIADRCRFDGRFLVVRGKLRTYKIHLGSGNVLMSPNDQYLCIVAAREPATVAGKKIYLPFDGDHTLSLILSKAFMLADDAEITDPTIVEQIRRRKGR